MGGADLGICHATNSRGAWGRGGSGLFVPGNVFNYGACAQAKTTYTLKSEPMEINYQVT